MESGYGIVDRSSGINSYYSASVSRNLGVPNGGWTQEPKRALLFARRQDADEFRKTFLLTIGDMAEIMPVPITEEKAALLSGDPT